MKFSVFRETLLEPLQVVQGVVERRQALPILANVLLTVEDGKLSVCATDMEVELVATALVEAEETGAITVPARKFIDICRALPAESRVQFIRDGEQVTVRSGRSRFRLSSLPADEFPGAEVSADLMRLPVEEGKLRRLIELTHFAMAQQDVRYYLNGLLLEIDGSTLRSVATDGHRLAVAELTLAKAVDGEARQIIVPRKAVGELMKLLGKSEEQVELGISSNAIHLSVPEGRMTSKLIDGRFPDYRGVIPDVERCDKTVLVDRESLRQSLARTSILSNEKYRAVRLGFESGLLRIQANNPEQEEAEEEVELEYEGEGLEVGFNVSYLLDALGVLPGDVARIYLSDAASSALIESVEAADCRFVVMPMRL